MAQIVAVQQGMVYTKFRDTVSIMREYFTTRDNKDQYPQKFNDKSL